MSSHRGARGTATPPGCRRCTRSHTGTCSVRDRNHAYQLSKLPRTLSQSRIPVARSMSRGWSHPKSEPHTVQLGRQWSNSARELRLHRMQVTSSSSLPVEPPIIGVDEEVTRIPQAHARKVGGRFEDDSLAWTHSEVVPSARHRRARGSRRHHAYAGIRYILLRGVCNVQSATHAAHAVRQQRAAEKEERLRSTVHTLTC